MASTVRLDPQTRRAHRLMVPLGLWMIIAPFILHYGQTAATCNEVITGLIITILGALRLRSPRDTWASWSNAILGVWLIFSPFVFGYAHPGTYWNQLFFGIILAILALSSLSGDIRHHSHLAH